jgi:hypothetical protein
MNKEQQELLYEYTYKKEFILDNKEVDVSLPGCKLSDIENLTYFFEKYKISVERGKPNQRIAKQLKTYIDINCYLWKLFC